MKKISVDDVVVAAAWMLRGTGVPVDMILSDFVRAGRAHREKCLSAARALWPRACVRSYLIDGDPVIELGGLKNLKGINGANDSSNQAVMRKWRLAQGDGRPMLLVTTRGHEPADGELSSSYLCKKCGVLVDVA